MRDPYFLLVTVGILSLLAQEDKSEKIVIGLDKLAGFVVYIVNVARAKVDAINLYRNALGCKKLFAAFSNHLRMIQREKGFSRL